MIPLVEASAAEADHDGSTTGSPREAHEDRPRRPF
jgi:hypothetical protein